MGLETEVEVCYKRDTLRHRFQTEKYFYSQCNLFLGRDELLLE